MPYGLLKISSYFKIAGHWFFRNPLSPEGWAMIFQVFHCSISLHLETREKQYGLQYFNSFAKLQELIGIKYPAEEIKTSEDFIGFLKSVLEVPVVKSKIDNLKLVRNKYIAHNEQLDSVPQIPEFWNEMVFLMDLAKLFVASLGEVYFKTNFFQYETIGFNNVHYTVLIELHWIISLVKKVIGDNHFTKWWDD